MRSASFSPGRDGGASRFARKCQRQAQQYFVGFPIVDEVVRNQRLHRWRGGGKRSTRSASGSWRRRGSNGTFAASKPLNVQTSPRCATLVLVLVQCDLSGWPKAVTVSTSGVPKNTKLRAVQRRSKEPSDHELLRSAATHGLELSA